MVSLTREWITCDIFYIMSNLCTYDIIIVKLHRTKTQFIRCRFVFGTKSVSVLFYKLQAKCIINITHTQSVPKKQTWK